MFSRRTNSGNNPRPPRDGYGIGRETPPGDNPPNKPSYRARPAYYAKPLVLKLICVLSEEDFRKEEGRLKENYPGPVILLKQYEEFVTEKDDKKLEAYRVAFNSVNNITDRIEKRRYKDLCNNEGLIDSYEWKRLKGALKDLHEVIKKNEI